MDWGCMRFVLVAQSFENDCWLLCPPPEEQWSGLPATTWTRPSVVTYCVKYRNVIFQFFWRRKAVISNKFGCIQNIIMCLNQNTFKMTPSSTIWRDPSRGETESSVGQFNWTSLIGIDPPPPLEPPHGIGRQVDLCRWCPISVVIIPFSSTWRMLVPSATKIFPSAPTVIPWK